MKKRFDFTKKRLIAYLSCLLLPAAGYSDEANEIVYVNYYDVERDVYTSLSDLLIVDCGWRYIR